jgi:hypothetical protein
MRDILAQTRAANAAGLYYVALFSALALPDICAALESRDGETNGSLYRAWFDRYAARGLITGEAAYKFRCAMLHQGRTGHPEGYSKIIFIEPSATGIVFHNNVMGDALNIDVRIFVEELVLAVENWLTTVETTPEYQKNIAAGVKRYPNGLPPYIVGLPVIA